VEANVAGAAVGMCKFLLLRWFVLGWSFMDERSDEFTEVYFLRPSDLLSNYLETNNTQQQGCIPSFSSGNTDMRVNLPTLALRSSISVQNLALRVYLCIQHRIATV